MSEFLVNLIFLAVGAGISLGTAFFLNERSHKLEREDKKHERVIVAREIRLKEGEDIIKMYKDQIAVFERILRITLNAQDDSELPIVNKLLAEYTNLNKEDKGKATYEVSVTSLGDEQLNVAWDKVNSSYEAYNIFYVYTAKLFLANGITKMQKEKKENVSTEITKRENCLSAIVEVLHRINELRSQ